MKIYKIKEFTRWFEYLFYYIELAACPFIAFIVGVNHLTLSLDASEPWYLILLNFLVAFMFSWMTYIGAKIWFGHRVVAIKQDKLSSRCNDFEVVKIFVKTKDKKEYETEIKTNQ